MISWIGLHKFADVILGITQKLPYVTSSNLFRQHIISKGIFWACFITSRSTGH